MTFIYFLIKRNNWSHLKALVNFSEDLNSGVISFFTVWSFFCFEVLWGKKESERYDRNLCPSFGIEEKKSLIELLFSDVAVKCQQKHHLSRAANPQTGCFGAAVCRGKEKNISYSLHASIIFFLGGQKAWGLLGKSFPSVLILADTSTRDWCRSLWNGKWSCAVVSATTQCTAEAYSRVRAHYRVALRNHSGRWLTELGKTSL